MQEKSKYITTRQIKKRNLWVDKISKIGGNFADGFDQLQSELSDEIEKEGIDSLLSHVRLCGAIPDHYPHDSSAEKLYSKYTDAILAEAFNFIGFTSLVLTERADVADVECVSIDYSFVADAKAFRLSRTAKNQKDFKVQAMDNWKHGKPHAIIVCPSYQLPARSSQIYEQAAARDVCVFSYSHLALLIQIVESRGEDSAQAALKGVFDAISVLAPSKNAQAYWSVINSSLLESAPSVIKLWREEKLATLDAIQLARKMLRLRDLLKNGSELCACPKAKL